MEGERTVLFIDDAAHLRRTIRDLLQADGFQVCDCGDGESALQAAGHGEFQFIIADYRMPGMNGAEVTRLLRGRFPGAVIIGLSWDDMQTFFIEAGADSFLQKPFEYDELLRLMNNSRRNYEP